MGKKSKQQVVQIDPAILQKYGLKYDDLQPIVRKREIEPFKEKWESPDALVKKLKSHPVNGITQSEE